MSRDLNHAKDRERLLGAIAELRRYVTADEGTQSWLTKAEAEMLLAVIERAAVRLEIEAWKESIRV